MTDISFSVETFFRVVPPWAVSIGLYVLAVALAVAAERILFGMLTRMTSNRDPFWRTLIGRTKGPLLLAFVMLALMIASAVSPLSEYQAAATRHLLLLVLMALIAWIANIAVNTWMTLHLRRFKLDSDDNLLARKHVTQTRILRQLVSTLIIVIAVGAMLMTFENVRQYGVSLLASAGAAGIIIGLALQTVLKNLFAGIQLAITQPIRIDDVVIVEGEWGNIEEITSTYVVVRIWDWRRLIVPLSYFIEQPFQNWTRENAAVMGSVIIYLDYNTPVPAIREKARQIAEASPLWDKQVFAVQVTDFHETTMQLRILVGAQNAGNAWDLRCLMREELVAFLQSDYPESLPRTRLTVSESDRPDDPVETVAQLKPKSRRR